MTLKKLGMTATEFKWLREFEAPAIDEDTGTYKVCWDLLPARWTSEPAYYDKDQWMNTPFMKKAKADTESAWVYDGLDSLLKKCMDIQERMAIIVQSIQTGIRLCCFAILV